MITFRSDPDGLISISTTGSPNGLPFKAKAFSIPFKKHGYSFLKPANPNDVLDCLPEELYDKDRFLPYWAEQWPSSEIMLSFLQYQNLIPGVKIIELGCGLGIISTLAGLNGHMLVSTDISFEALIFTKTNVELNKGRPLPCCIDWRALPFKGQFDLLIASDILYEPRWVEPILNCCKILLANNGRAWIADPCRSFWNDFKEAAKKYRFKCDVIHQAQTSENKHTVEIVEIRKF